MDLHVKKLHVIEEILAVTNEGLIDKLEALLKKDQQKEEDQRVGIEQYNRELEEADAEIDRGDFLTHEEAVKEIRSWREK